MKKYVFRWNKFFGLSMIVGSILWGQYMILGALEKIGEASHWFAYVPDSEPIMMTFLLIGFVGCALIAVEEVEAVSP